MCQGCEAASRVGYQHIEPAPKNAQIPRENSIITFVQCRKCVAELPVGESPQTYARTDIGFTENGLQVFCLRHKENILHIDFQGHRLPAMG